MEILHARARRKLQRGLKRKPQALLKKLRKAKKACGPLEKPEVVKTHLRDMIVLPEMVGSVVGVYNGKTFNQVEIKVGLGASDPTCPVTASWSYLSRLTNLPVLSVRHRLR